MGLSVQVGRYDVQRALGKGATGTVYLARDTFTGREVALKTIEPEVFRDPEFGAVYRSQFRNEASLAGKLRHPHIAAILDALVQEDSGYIAMEYVPGGDLSGHVTPDRLLPVADDSREALLQKSGDQRPTDLRMLGVDRPKMSGAKIVRDAVKGAEEQEA